MVLACWLSASRAYSSCLTIWTNARRATRPAKAQAMNTATTSVRDRTTLGGGDCPPSDSSPRLQIAPAKPALERCRSASASVLPPFLPESRGGPAWFVRVGGRRERCARGEAGAGRDELTGKPHLIVGRHHHAELGAGLALDARERLERGQLHPEPIARLLELGPRHAQGIEPIGQAHVLDAKPHDTEDQRDEKAR